MSGSPSPYRLKPSAAAFFVSPAATLPPLVTAEAAGQRRARLWELSANLHCSVIGTCLSAAELRAFFVRAGGVGAKTATDNALHGDGVLVAARRDAVGKMLNKTLDRRHEVAIKRFGKAATLADVRASWEASVETGDIPGGYWAVLTHPLTDRQLIQDAFGEVHMLSHMVGRSSRLDIVRLRDLEGRCGEHEAKIGRQETRLAAAAAERADLMHRVDELEAQIARLRGAAAGASRAVPVAEDGVADRLAAERTRADGLAERLRVAEAAALAARDDAERARAREAQTNREVAALEAALARTVEPGRPAAPDPLARRTILYVGGRPGSSEQIRVWVAGRGGVLLLHDGGIEQSLTTLPGLVSRADAVCFPVDCVSHSAVNAVKKTCRDLARLMMPLRSAGLGSFAAAIQERLLDASFGEAAE